MEQDAKSKAPADATGRQRVCVECTQPEAREVVVAGSFNEWNPLAMPLTRAGEGKWTAELLLPPGRHEYLFVVDGQWLPDPAASESVPNPYGGLNSVMAVSAPVRRKAKSKAAGATGANAPATA